ncbi:glucose-1-phosphate adenylyltransferase [Fontibacillus phaseoli]|uniref:Glucose-1-phosphate adenylyltransferase n=1 Tax=Fontibacillus phaseoli TaxID=1416533 RepID=A0A369BT33_9BACL|nr:glucose-1-phosphate adenylyltransferase [Fontibacillus phaseoli]RCX23577.1 glucose-1-phosphate adenylyltransferase [Fontibacillus phaseoli]
MKKKDCIAMLLAGGEGRRLSPLTSKLAKPAVPFGGHYRIIDFPLSNCVNSGIDTIGVLTQYEAESLHEHIGEGEAWNLPRCADNGISLLPSYNAGVEEYAGTADAIFKNIEYVDSHEPENVLILSGDHIYHMDYREMLQFHISSEASATISVMPVPWDEAHRFGVMSTDEQSRITEFAEKPEKPASNLASMGIYLFKWDFLKQHLIEDAMNENSSHDFGKDVIPKMLAGERPLHAYEFKGYWRDVGTVQSLWEAHMDLLAKDSDWKFLNEAWPMYTRDQASSKPRALKTRSVQTKSSLIHDCCALEGYSERSVLFVGTEVGRYTKIKDSVIMPNARIGRGALIERAIIGEGAVIHDGAVIKGTADEIIVIGPYETVVAKPALRPQPSRLLKEVYDKTARLRAEGLSS